MKEEDRDKLLVGRAVPASGRETVGDRFRAIKAEIRQAIDAFIRAERERCAALVEKHGCTCPFPGHQHLESCHVRLAAAIREGS